jgi:hypothetical protein
MRSGALILKKLYQNFYKNINKKYEWIVYIIYYQHVNFYI